ELGQPLHAFDFDRLEAGRVVVRASEAGETFETLDGKTRALPAGTLLICDGGTDASGRPCPIALAGVMGGANSEVTKATTTVLLESAYFDPSTVRRASKALGLSTDASYRFERGVDPEGQLVAAARAAALIVEVAGGRIVPGAVDAVVKAMPRRQVSLRLSRLAALLGTEIPDADVRRILRALGFEVEEDGTLGVVAEQLMEGRRVAELPPADTLRLVVPSWRPDVTREVDVIEEVGRIWGYDRLPEPAHTPVPAVPPLPEPALAFRRRVRSVLAGAGFREVWATSFLPRSTAEWLRLDHAAFGAGGVVMTFDPERTEPLALRPALLPGLLAVAAYNQRQGRRALRLFEVGHVFRSGDNRALVPGYDEREHVGILLAGLADEGGWDRSARSADLFDAKGAVEHLLAALRLDARLVPADVPGGLLDDPLTVEVQGEPVGLVGRLTDAAVDTFDGRAPVVYAELNLTALLAHAGDGASRAYVSFSRLPGAERDLAFVLPRTEAVGDVLDTIRTVGTPLVRDVRVFDLYEGEHVAEGYRSVAFSLRLAADMGTLHDAEIEATIRAVREAVETRHAATLRA
ncbi:MAG TPA: phenylalanine--tRNA ligase subunit beta, partial [Rhodothermales bacterium]|nr:phenylalanine--tRNA ligase subunit beta [Rhodothermales bacterium]